MPRFMPTRYSTTVGRVRDLDDPRGADYSPRWRKVRVTWWQWRDHVARVRQTDLGAYDVPGLA